MQSGQLRVADPHPDSDLLTAFAEQSLRPGEREQVLMHLAQCSECREIVMLAGAAIPEPEFAAAAVGRPPAAKTGKAFWSWRPLRWTAAAATAAVVLSAVWLNRPERESLTGPQTTPVAQSNQKNPASPETAADQLISTSELPAVPQTIEKIPSSKTTPAVRDDEQLRTKRTEPVPPRLSAPSQKVQVNESSTTVATENKGQALDLVDGQATRQLSVNGRSYAQLSQLQPGLAKSQVSSAPKAPLSGPIPSGNAAAAAKEEIANEKDEKSLSHADGALVANAPQSAMSYSRKPAEDLAPANQVTQSGAISPGTSRDAAKANVSGRNEMVTVEAESVQVETAGLGTAPRAKAVMSPPMLWRVTKSGELQQSKDSGSSWHTVLGEHPSRFRAVAFSGATVWAGGDDGALWSSQNNGETWRKLAPSADGRSPRGAVQRIQLTAPGGVAFKTKAGEVWTSADGGSTWTVATKQ